MLRCELMPIESFDRVAADWATLASNYRNAPFMEADFVSALIESFADGGERIVRVRSGDVLIATGILCRRGLMWETFQPSQLPIGCLVVRPGTSWTTLLESIARVLPGASLGVAASQQDPVSMPRPAHEGRISTLDYIETAAIDVDGTFDDYWNERGKNLRQNLRKQRRKLADEGVTTELDMLADPKQVMQSVDEYAALESAGWKAGGGTAVGAGNNQGRFYRSVMERYCAKGRGRILKYRFGGRVVVVDLCIESDDTLVILKTTYDESIRGYSPAALMREEAFRRIWEEGRIRRIEFFGRMMEWHTRWTAQSRTLYHVNWHRWPTLVRIGSRLSLQMRRRSQEPVPATQEAS